jgi:hypothetical protein
MIANVLLGDELGFYRAMADNQPISSEDLADKTYAITGGTVR